MRQTIRFLGVLAGLVLVAATNTAQAEPTHPSATPDPIFGSRTENSDGSVSMTVGHRFDIGWETKIGTDVKYTNSVGSSTADNMLRGAPAGQSTGAVWGNVTVPTPYIWDKTSLQARIDDGEDRGKLGATLSRSIPFGQSLSLTWQNSYSVSHPLSDRHTETPVLPMMATPVPTGTPDDSTAWTTSQQLRLDIGRSGTSFSAGTSLSNADDLWHNKLSVEQTVVGPLKLTTSIEDPGTAASKKTISAAFKQVW